MKAVVRFDGGCRPTNPGHAAFACVIDLDGEQHVVSRYIGWKTNNQAEYMGCIVGIKYAIQLGASEITLISDSQLVVHQVKGEWKARQDEIKSFVSEARKLLDDHFGDRWKFKWNKRSENKLADGICTEAIYWAMNQNPWTPQKIKDNRIGKVVDPFGEQSALHTPITLRRLNKDRKRSTN